MRDAAGGAGRLAVIEGGAGVGKSRLLSAARRLADERGMRVLSGTGSTLEREFAFGVVRQLFEPLLTAPAERERLLSGAAVPAARIFDSLEDGMDDGSFAALHGLYWLLANAAASAPVLLTVDDLQWCDGPSLRYLAYLARRIEGQPLLVLGAVRDRDPGSDARLLAEIAHEAVLLRPRPLTGSGGAAVVRAQLGQDADEAFCEVCHAATGGNPLLLRQLLRALHDDDVRPDATEVHRVAGIGGRAVSHVVLMRLGRLPAEAAAVARAVAVLGDGAPRSAVAELAGVDDAGLLRATRDLAEAEILRPEMPLGFVHALVQEAVHQDMPPFEREAWHARAADILRAMGAPVEQVAAQLLAVPPMGDEAAAGLLEAAAHAAAVRGGPEGAIALLRRALEEPPAAERRAAILVELGRAETMIDGPAATEHLAAGLEATESPAERARVAELLATALRFTGRHAESIAVARRVAGELPAELAELRRRLDAHVAFAAHFSGDTQTLGDLLRPTPEPPLATDAGSRMLAMVAATEMALVAEPAGASVRLARAALADDVLVDAGDGLFAVGGIRVLALADDPEALVVAERLRLDAHRRGSSFLFAVLLWHAFALLRRGELQDAAAFLRSSIEETERWGRQEHGDLFAPSVLARVLLERGDPAAARGVLTRVQPPSSPSESGRWWRGVDLELLLAEGRADAVPAAADTMAQLYAHVSNPAAVTWHSAKIRALHALGRVDEALALADEEVALALRVGAPSTVCRALRVRGLLRGPDGAGDLRDAVDAVEGSVARLEHARALAALGGALRRGRRPTDAREPLRRALELADACGAGGLAKDVRIELRAAGLRPRRSQLGGVAALTASERRVAGLAADGGTNREIAQALFVTVKTVEVHLGNAYRKLGIASRAQLAQALAGTGEATA